MKQIMQCPAERAVYFRGGKWKIRILLLLYQNKNNTTQALLKIETEINASPERDEIISFVQNSGRGIMKGYNQK